MASINRALIIAAGNGSRLQPASGELPKPLTPVCGVPLLKRLLISARLAGITSCVIVLGYQGEALKQAIETDPEIGLAIDWVENSDWHLSNGVSVLKGKDYLQEDFVLLMADHLFEPKTLASFIRRSPRPGEVVLAVDRKIDQIYDIDDATKVRISGSKITKIGKKIEDFNAVDTGMFLCSKEIFSALEEALCDGDCSLSDGMNALIQKGKLRPYDIKEGWWLDVDTPIALKQAEKMIYSNLRHASDSFITRHFTRPLSTRLTKLLVKTPIRGKILTHLSLVLGVVAAAMFAWGTYWSVLVGAVLFQIITVLGSSGRELAQIKLDQTKRSKFFDTVFDNVSYIAFLLGITLGYYRQNPELYVLIVGFFTVFDAALGLNIMYNYVRRIGNWDSGRFLDAIYPKKHLHPDEKINRNIFERFAASLKFVLRREAFASLTLVFALFGALSAIFWTAFLFTHFMALAVLYAQSRYLMSHPPKMARFNP